MLVVPRRLISYSAVMFTLGLLDNWIVTESKI
jgi:hypothetical protein